MQAQRFLIQYGHSLTPAHNALHPEQEHGGAGRERCVVSDQIRWAQWMHIWFWAAERQESRLLQEADGVPDDSEFFLYVDAMRNVLRGAQRILGNDHAAIRAFESATPDLRHVRNMIEHFDAHVVGRGRLQETASGLRAPFLVTSTGDGQSRQIVVLTHVAQEQRSYVVDSLSSLKAAADLVQAALDAAGITQVSEAVARVQSR